jgi:hypothetical protein
MFKKKYKLAVSDKVLVQVEGKTSDEGGKPTSFKFSLLCNRLPAAELADALDDKGETAVAMVTRLVTDWKDQRLVLEDDGTPAAFSADALDALLDIAGMGMQCLNAYLRDVGVKTKNS